MQESVSVAYTRDNDHWEVGKVTKITTLDELKTIAKDTTDVCFVSGRGIGVLTLEEDSNYGFFDTGYTREHYYQLDNPTADILEQIAEAFLFDRQANAKMWYCCLKYALENKECRQFWDKYKDTSAGTKFMALMLSEQLNDEQKEYDGQTR